MVLPGLVDPHVHFYEDFETWTTGTSAAAGGGVTSVVEMPFSLPATHDVESLNYKIRKATRESIVDFGFHAEATPLNLEEIGELAKEGVVSFKIFHPKIGDHISTPEDDAAYLQMLTIIAKNNALASVHAENKTAIEALQHKFIRSGRIAPSEFPKARPVLAEVTEVTRSLLFAKITQLQIYFVHLSTGSAASIIANVKKNPARNEKAVFTETCPQYLLLNSSVYADPDIGPYARIIPPLRKEEERIKLWKHLFIGTIDVIATDHCPMSIQVKEMGRTNIFRANNWIPRLETALSLMLTSVNKGTISLAKLVQLMASQPAKIMGYYPTKGVIQPGSDADLVVIDLKKEKKITIDELHTKGEFTLYEGWKVQGIPEMTISRGKIVMKNGYLGDIVGKPAHGKYLKSEKSKIEV